MAEQERPQGQEGKRPNNALDEWKLRLFGAVLEGAQRQSSCRVAMIANQLRFQVFTNVESAPDGGFYSARMSSPVMSAFLLGMEQILAGTRESIRITCWNADDQKQKFLECTVLGGRTDQGEIFIGFAPDKEGAKPCRFMLTFDDWHRLLDREGNELSKREHSDLFAGGWLRIMRDLAASVLAFNFKDRNEDAPAQDGAAPAQNNGGGNNGGYQKKQWGNQGGGNGNYPKKQWNGNGGGGNGNYQKKQWNNNGNGNGGGGNNNYQQNQGQENKAAMTEGFDDNFPF